jgi:hypothetical protein
MVNYILQKHPGNYLGVIANPDFPGALCNFTYSGFALGTPTCAPSAFRILLKGVRAVTTREIHDTTFQLFESICYHDGSGSRKLPLVNR